MRYLSLPLIPKGSLDFTNLIEVGKGKEKRCFIDTKHPRVIFKCSPLNDCKDNLRESYYLRLLKKRGIPTTHLPRFFGLFKTDKYLVSVQERIFDSTKFKVLPLPQILNQPEFSDVDLIQSLYDDFKSYLLRYRIVPNDMYEHNFMVKLPWEMFPLNDNNNVPIYTKFKSSYLMPKLILIDGLGATSFIPVANYVRSQATQRILKQCAKFTQSVRDFSSHHLILST